MYQRQRVSWITEVLLFVQRIPVHTASVLWLKYLYSLKLNKTRSLFYKFTMEVEAAACTVVWAGLVCSLEMEASGCLC